MSGVDPSVFRRYFREEDDELEEKEQEAVDTEPVTAGGYNRSDVRWDEGGWVCSSSCCYR